MSGVTAQEKYLWTRWWVPLGQAVPVTGGFPEDPGGPYAEYLDLPTQRLKDLDEVACLVLLGDAGMGKSTELADDEVRHTASGTPCLLLDLGAEERWADVEDALLSNRALSAWRQQPDGPFVLLIDSVDEVAVSMRVLADKLPQVLEQLPRDNLRLRVASRAYAFPARLREQLEKLFDANAAEFELVPLTRSNVATAAAAHGRDGSAFLNAVNARNIGVLAARPITLRMLLDLDAQAPLPTSRTELYRQGTERLVREVNERVLDTAEVTIPLDDLIRAAQKLAAVTVLAGQQSIAVQKRPSHPDGPPALDELAADTIDAGLMRQVTASSLFAAGPGCTVRWTHRDFAEFLTAQRLAAMDAPDVIALLADPSLPGSVVPQLAGTATWTALLNPDVFDWLLVGEPELLAVSDIGEQSPAIRRRLVQALLDRVETAPRIDIPQLGPRLDYPELAEDIAPYLDAERSVWVRRAAARLLHDTGRSDLDDELVSIVEGAAAGQPDNHGDEVRLASTILAGIGGHLDDDAVARLLAVVQNQGAPLRIRSYSIEVLSEQQPTPDFLDALAAGGLDGSPSWFLDGVGRAMANAVANHHLEVGTMIDWLASNGMPRPAGSTASSLREVASKGQLPNGFYLLVITCAAVAAAQPAQLTDQQLENLAATTADILQCSDYRTYERTTLLRDAPAEGRRRIASIVLAATEERMATYRVVRMGLLNTDDFEWAFDRYAELEPGALADAYEVVIRMLAPAPTAENRDAVLALAGGNERSAAFVRTLFSDEALQLYADEVVRQEQAAQDEAQRNQRENFDLGRLQFALEGGTWPDVVSELSKPIGRRHWAGGASLTAAPGWQQLPATVQGGVMAVAIDFLASLTAQVDPGAVDLVGHAYTMVAESVPAALEAVDPAVFSVWFPVLLGEPGHHLAVLAIAQRLAATHTAQLEAAYIAALESDLTSGFPRNVDLLGHFTSGGIEDLLDRIARAGAGRLLVREALRALAVRDATRATTTMFDLVRERPAAKPPHGGGAEPAHPDEVAWDRAVGAAAALAGSSMLGEHLDQLLEAMAASTDFASEVIDQADPWDERRLPWSILSSTQLGHLYVWAIRNLPPEPDRPPGVYDVIPVYEFPKRIRRMLTSRVSEESVTALYGAADELDDSWLREEAADLTVELRRSAWEPIKPREVLKVLDNPHKRVIVSEAQLARVLLDALDAVADDIRQDTNHRTLYWHRQHGTSPKAYIPLDEPEFMIRLGWHLSRFLKGVSLRHEVELNHRFGTVEGSEADIQAIVQTGSQDISVVIEGKGIWHAEVETAIETQLHDRYLTGSATFTGIYVVGAFRGDLWLTADSRRATAEKRDPDQLRQYLSAEAGRLSQPPKAIHARVINIPIDASQ